MKLTVTIEPWRYSDTTTDNYEFRIEVQTHGEKHGYTQIVAQEPWESLLDLEFEIARREFHNALRKAGK